MRLTVDQVRHVAKLANLPVSDKEIEVYSKQISEILDYVKLLDGVDTSNVEATVNVTVRKNITREDIPGKSLTQQEALSNSSQTKDGYFVTKAVFENDQLL